MGRTEFSALAVMGATIYLITVTTMQLFQGLSTFDPLIDGLVTLSLLVVSAQLVLELFIPAVPLLRLQKLVRLVLTVTGGALCGATALTLLAFIASWFVSGVPVWFSSQLTSSLGLLVLILFGRAVVFLLCATSVFCNGPGRSFAVPVLGVLLVGLPPWTETLFALELMATVGATFFVVGHFGWTRLSDSESASTA